MNHYRERRAYDFYEEEDHYPTPRAGTFDCVDAVLPWRSEEPLPPPVPPKNDDLKESRSAAVSIPKRVTPWLLRRVKMPVTRATKTALAPTQTPAPQKASSTDIIRGSPKPEPPAYHAVPQQQQQQQIYPSEERSAITRTRGPGPAVVLQSQQSTVQVQLRTPPKPAAVAHRSARGEGETQSGRRPTSHHSGSPQLRSVRSAHEERSRPAASAGGTRTQARVPPLLPAAVAVQPERAHLPSYHSAQPFPNSPAPPPYRVSAEDNSYPTSVRSRSLPRSSRKHGARTFEKEATPLPPLPPLPSHHLHHPQLSSSAISRIQAGFKVSKEFGDAIMQQELRLVTPTSDHSRLDHHPVPNPRLGRRFLSASELQSHRRARLRTDKNTPEHEARQRTSNKSSSNVGRCSGDSRQRVVSAHPGRGQDKASQRGRR